MTNFWQELTRPFTVMAPMDDVTDDVFRQVMLEAGRADVFYTEFTNIDGLVHGANGIPLGKLKFGRNQHPVVAQLWGTDPKNMEKSAKIAAKLRFDGIDINMGCPVRDVVKKGAGSALIGNFELAGSLIDAAKKGAEKVPVSVKTRLGRNKNIANEWMEFLLKKGIAALIIHGRLAKDMSKGLASWEEIGKIVELRDRISPTTLIIGNGDVKNYSEVLEKHEKYGVDGIMIGRGVFTNPWVFRKDNSLPNKNDLLKLLKYHIDLYEKTWGETKNFAKLKKFFKMYVKDFSGASELRMKLMETKSLGEVKEIINSNLG